MLIYSGRSYFLYLSLYAVSPFEDSSSVVVSLSKRKPVLSVAFIPELFESEHLVQTPCCKLLDDERNTLPQRTHSSCGSPEIREMKKKQKTTR